MGYDTATAVHPVKSPVSKPPLTIRFGPAFALVVANAPKARAPAAKMVKSFITLPPTLRVNELTTRTLFNIGPNLSSLYTTQRESRRVTQHTVFSPEFAGALARPGIPDRRIHVVIEHFARLHRPRNVTRIRHENPPAVLCPIAKLVGLSTPVNARTYNSLTTKGRDGK